MPAMLRAALYDATAFNADGSIRYVIELSLVYLVVLFHHYKHHCLIFFCDFRGP